MAESTVRRRIDWLVREGYVQISALTDPLKIGFPVWVTAEVQAELRSRDRLAEELAAFPEVSFIAVTTGPFNIQFTAVFRSNEHFDGFMSHQLAKLPGIRHIVTATILRLAKRTFAYGVPVDDGRAPRVLADGRGGISGPRRRPRGLGVAVAPRKS